MTARLWCCLLMQSLHTAVYLPWLTTGRWTGCLCFVLFFLSGQRDQEEVRRRFASITYSDPLYWDRPAAPGEETKWSTCTALSENMISLMSPLGGDSATTDKLRLILVQLFFSVLCSFLFLLSHTTTAASSPLSLFFPGPEGYIPGSRPASPQPIRLTRPVMKQSSAADIVLEKPVETGWVTMSFTLFLHSDHFHF